MRYCRLSSVLTCLAAHVVKKPCGARREVHSLGKVHITTLVSRVKVGIILHWSAQLPGTGGYVSYAATIQLAEYELLIGTFMVLFFSNAAARLRQL